MCKLHHHHWHGSISAITTPPLRYLVHGYNLRERVSGSGGSNVPGGVHRRSRARSAVYRACRYPGAVAINSRENKTAARAQTLCEVVHRPSETSLGSRASPCLRHVPRVSLSNLIPRHESVIIATWRLPDDDSVSKRVTHRPSD
jgi:hypothetical protein